MKKIGILTYHNNTNRGSHLQAYCLWRALSKMMKDTTVEIIDYRTLSKEIKRIYSTSPKRFVKQILDYNTSFNFLKKYNALSSNKIITNNYNKAIEFLKEKDYDMIVVGSDVVWRIENEKYFPPSRPFPNAYFLNPCLDTIKVSYAPSASITDLRSLSKEKIDKIRYYLSNFDKISVRDTHTEKLLHQIGISNLTRVPDPTILIDIPQVNGKALLESYGISVDEPILGIHRVGKLENKIIDYFREKNYQIVSPETSKNSDLDLWGKLDPLEYYSLFKYFDFVVTGSLHSTIFSIKNRTPFATLDFSFSNVVDKKETLLEDFSLLDRHLKKSEIGKENVLDKIKKCEKDFDANQINKRLKFLRNKGIDYIKELEVLLNEKNV